ncbi:MAG TPA: ABC transporter substrate-binding protein, partial [Xanthobacteraceae bacterium]|nr:ABC transporter substrate-binding protein [Xanthobacteraceae bacterium]
MRCKSLFVCATATASLMALPAGAQDYKIGISAGLTGYAATVDRAWRDGVEVAAASLNETGGIAGRKLAVVTEDNRSEPQEAVTVYRKMISSDNVNVFLSGCVSAGNFAAAPVVVRAQIPMVLCSILPPQPDQKWAFSTLPPAGMEVEKRLEYLKEKTQIKKIGVLHDPTPYAGLQKSVAEKIAPNYGLEVVGIEQYKQDDADLSVQISKMNAAGARAVLKIGLGGTTLTAAKNIKQLGLDMLMLTSVEDLAVFRPVAEVLGDKFFFVGSPSQVYDALPDGALKAAIAKFLEPWRAKYGDRDPNWAARGWDG